MRILHIIKSLDRGGAEVLLSELARLAPSRGLKFEVAFYLPQHRRMVEELRQGGVEVHCLETPTTARMLAQVGATTRLIRSRRPDIVHAHLPVAGAVARLAAASAGVPLVYTEHNVFSGYHPLTRMLSLATWTLQSHVVAVSQSVAKTLPATVPVTVVPNGIPVRRFSEAAGERGRVRKELGLADDEFVVGTVAVFRTAKRLERFVRCIEDLRARGHRVVGLIVGYGPLEAELRATVAGSTAAGSIRMLGASTEVASLLSAFDLWLMTSEHEGLPLALLEAMAAGLPVVATPVGGIPEVVNGENGVLAEPENLADAVASLVEDDTRRHSLSQAARATVVAGFGIEKTLTQLIDVYRQVAR